MRPNLVFHFERLEGINRRLMTFAEWWQDHGPFPITIPETGGFRRDDALQAKLFAEGKTKAKTLEDTPHGRGAALDAYPAILDPTGKWVAGIHLTTDAMGRELFRRYGVLAESFGFRWGGKFAPLDGNGLGWDCPHIELMGWRDLPYVASPKE